MTVTERLSALMMSSSDEGRRVVAESLATFANRLDGSTEVDWSTGEVRYDEAVIRSAAEDLQRSTAYAIGADFPQSLTENLRSGFVVLHGNGRELIPWNSLRDPLVAQRISAAQLEALGVSAAEPETIRKEMEVRFLAVPGIIDAQVIKGLSNSLLDKRIVTASRSADARLGALMRARFEGSPTPIMMREKPDGGDGSHDTAGGGGVGKIVEDIVKLVPNFVTGCLPKIEPHWATLSTGVGIELDRSCALELVKILRGGGAPALAAAGAAAIGSVGAGISAALAAAVAAAGGWVTLIVAVCLLVFSGWLEAVISDAGAVIHFPWWAGFGPIPYGR
ncbi:hypothetical protein [Streptomyces olivochromogenes]|uniref:hypothetical protein n=1 Tax=Streptomyces olivochromogenes TaxID=1963 RepID=UPI00369731C6